MDWRHRSLRYTEKLATPDTSVGDLICDVDPVKVTEDRSLGDPDTIHFGLVPRGHRGVVAINELPNLAERMAMLASSTASEVYPAAPPILEVTVGDGGHVGGSGLCGGTGGHGSLIKRTDRSLSLIA